MKRIVIGTAGHIDHGKTSLVRAMTGIDTDRLKEEKKRGISIELGFAPLKLPNGQLAGIVDVPGHERFIRQMLAGAFGVDLVLLIIAADEGVMPQTREHLDIIQLLGIEQGIVVLTKKDLIDEEWLMMVEEDVKDYLKETDAAQWPIVPVSSVTGENISKLLQMIVDISADVQERPSLGKVRLPIDRVFTMTGFGTVVTGTLWSGQIGLNDSLQVLPWEKTVRVRTLQVHNSKVDKALAGQRVAVNLQGIEVHEIRRGNVLVTPGFLQTSYRINANLRLLKSSPRPLRNWARIRFHLGTDEAMGRLVLLDRDELQPGESGYVQLVLEKPVVSAKNDRFVVRFYSPVTTIGGGIVIDPSPPKQKRFNEDVLKQMVIQEEGSLQEVVLQELEKHPLTAKDPGEIAKAAGASLEDTEASLAELMEQEEIFKINVDSKSYFICAIGMDQVISRITGVLEEYRVKYPLRKGILREELRTRYFKEYPTKLFNALLGVIAEKGFVFLTSTHVQISGDPIQIGENTQAAIRSVMDLLNQEPLSPPGINELQELILSRKEDPVELIAYLEGQDQIVKVAEGMYFSRTALDDARGKLDQHFASQSELSLGQARDIWNSSRKYTLPILEYFDRIRYTKRMGDNRVRFGK
ncbi:MAG: selenocysteine-specific translation elongation factor [Candidatus Saccharibacteria bacterium]